MCNKKIDSCINIFEKRGDYERAIYEYAKKLDDTEEVYYRICFCAFELHKEDLFDFWYKKYLEKNFGETNIFYSIRVLYYFFRGNADKMQENIKMLGKDIGMEFICIYIGILLYRSDYKACISYLHTKWAKFPEVLYYISSAYYSLGDYKKALSILKDIPESSFFYLYDMKIKLYKKIGHIEEASRLFEIVEKRIKDNNISYLDYSTIGNCYFHMDNFNYAIKYYTAYIKNFPYDNYGYNALGNCYMKLGNNDLALKAYIKGTKNVSGIYRNYSYIGIAKILVGEGKFYEAEKILEKIYNSGYKTAYLCFLLGKCKYNVGTDFQESQMYFLLSLSINPHYGASKRFIKKIEKRRKK